MVSWIEVAFSSVFSKGPENGSVLRLSCNYLKSSSGKMRMTNKIDICGAIESA